MIEEKEFQGYWWLPEEPENKVGGIVKFSPENGVRLNLFSMLNEDPEYLDSDSVLRTQTICGATTDGKKITLRDCIRDRYSLQGGFFSSQHIAKYLFSGEHLVEDNIQFNEMKLKYPLLQDWSTITSTSYSGSIIEDTPAVASVGDTFEISYEAPEPFEVEVEDVVLKLSLDVDINMQRVGGGSIVEDAQFIIRPKDGEITLQNGLEHAKKLQDFITLATGKKVQPKEIEGKLYRFTTSNEIGVYYSTLGGIDAPDSVHPYKTNFLLPDIADDFEVVMNTWYEKYEKLEPVFNLYFGYLYHSDMYLQNQLLSLTRALESYHRTEKDDKYLEEDEFEEVYELLCDSIPAKVDGDFKRHLEQGTFKYCNEYSLRKRLSDVVEEYENILSELPFDLDGKHTMVANTRNYYTHYDDSTSPKAEDTDELYELILFLRASIETIFLTEIEIPEERVIDRLSKRYQQRLS